jgi:hypothetical protein
MLFSLSGKLSLDFPLFSSANLTYISSIHTSCPSLPVLFGFSFANFQLFYQTQKIYLMYCLRIQFHVFLDKIVKNQYQKLIPFIE